ncbi:DUF402 domain-containing protein [Actinoplanes awajinensis]|uniref:DUF402 domain-containing protein n=1 Tax=Actinoplanes awajinensis subsp. mycoplanecinus TaxID=135947 RepID=A0A117MLJ4_9ACTN|nr:DUF402 domain-containing protein [Actinoplanes awajinensis]KUL23919.1 hypothetical protein ADL15_44685 [Actinoplanes awajinensis subsp. mycoplanecinus]
MKPSIFAPGATVVRRDVLDGRVWGVTAHRALDDDGDRLTLVSWPGVVTYALTSWIAWLRTGAEASREQSVPDLAAGRGELGEWVWRDTVVLSWVGLDPGFTVQRYLPVTGGPGHWKVNFEGPVTRTAFGIDTCDLLLDLVAEPDTLRWQWKDEDEYAQARRLGMITDAGHRRVEQARERAVAFVETRSGPLSQDWSTWQVPAEWPLPSLPPGALDRGAP